MEFLFTFPLHFTSSTGVRFLAGEVEMMAEIDFADPRDKNDYGITALYVPDLGNKSKWRRVLPTSNEYEVAVAWLENNESERERLQSEWDEHCLEERLTRAPVVHEHSTHIGRPS